jgi:DNA transformation protein and related proteins
MASDHAFVQHVCDQLRGVGDLSYRKMFGEYALYVGGKVVGLVCDNQLFLKPTDAGRALLGTPVEGPPYPGAKPHFVLDEHLDNPELLTSLFVATEAVLPRAKAKSNKDPKSKANAKLNADAKVKANAESKSKSKTQRSKPPAT